MIENFFGVLSTTVPEEALSKVITRDTYEQFSERVKRAIMNASHAYIDRTIESLNKRMPQIIKRKG